jgi:Fuc2NAc and GlcNAc transferase
MVVFLFSFIVTYRIKLFYEKRAFFDEVNERSSHTIPTPHGGGIAIALSWFLGVFYLELNGMIESKLFYALLVGVIVSVVSAIDDIYNLCAKVRFFVHLLVASLGLYFLGGLDIIPLGFFTIENSFITNIFALFMIVWFINLYNFLDGIDGYAGGEALFLSLAGYILFGSPLFLLLGASVAGFFLWNFPQAKIFMGDVGSTLLGYNVAIFTLYYTDIKEENFWIWILLFSLFWVDATLTLLRRKLNAERIFLAHKKHFYQRLTQSGWSHSKVSSYAFVVNLVLLFTLTFPWYLSLFSTFLLLFFILKYIEKQKSFYDFK